MKFMIITRLKDSLYALPPAKQKEIGEAMWQHHDKVKKEGKLEETYFLGNMKGSVAIFDMNSSEDLVHVIYEAPLLPFMDVEITPLVDVDVVRKAQAKK